MSASPTPQFEIPNEMRAVAERKRPTSQQLVQAAQEAVSLEEWGDTSQVGALDTSKKARTFAERNVLSAFEFAQKIVQTKEIQKLVRTQTEFLQSQMQTLASRPRT